MKICLWSVGKGHEEYVKSGVEDFTKRITRYYPAEWNLIAPARQPANDLKKKEAALILNQLQKDDYLVALDERGRQFSSGELAEFIQIRANNSTKRLIFLIGGAYGLDETVMNRADQSWSLSRLVFPHQLVRLILAEQLYRACSILRNEKYHHE
jgi:23S rRNA (pseudouridine1915-N3)-methyltransferase